MKNTLLVLAIAFTSFVHAQKQKVVSGNFDFLKDQKELNLVMDYSEIKFYKENMNEEAYILKREKDILKDGKDANEVKKWIADWEHSKTTTFGDKFKELMNKNSSIVTSLNNTKAKYTLTVKTVWIYPGWFAGVMAQPSKVTTVLVFTETNNPNNVLLKIDSKEAPGDSFVGVANNNDRIAEGYAKTAKTLAKKIEKEIK